MHQELTLRPSDVCADVSRLSVVDEILHPEPYTREELTKLLGVSVSS